VSSGGIEELKSVVDGGEEMGRLASIPENAIISGSEVGIADTVL
jgi:hypothetical protein